MIENELNTVELLSRLRGVGVELRAENDKLRIDAPKGALSASLREELFQRKGEILRFFEVSSPKANDEVPLPEILPVPRNQRLPLSFSQERLWFLHQFEPESVAYSMPRMIRLRGTLDIKALTQAFYELARRHETLRTTFHESEGRLEQLIASEPSFSPKVIDLRHLPEEERENEVLRLTDIESKAAV